MVVVEGEEEVVVVFPRLLPRRDIVERVWRGCRACLFEGRREKERDGAVGGNLNAEVGIVPAIKRRETS